MRLSDYHSPNFPTPQALALEQAREQVLKSSPDAPVLFFSEDELRRNARRFIAAMPRVQAHFAVKANPHPRVLSILAKQGLGFEIASQAELQLLLDQGTATDQIYYSNPIKAPAHLRFAAAHGVRWYVVDSVAEVQKIAKIVPQAKLYLRIATSNIGAVLPLAGKFGCNSEEALSVMQACVEHKMQLAGVSFHVGSQCLQAESWRAAIRDARACFSQMRKLGFTPELLNLGGGYPTPIDDSVPSIECIGAEIEDELHDLDSNIHVIAEPGRNMVGSAGWLSTQVVGTAIRNGQHWLYLDTGYYGGLMELGDHYALPVHSDRQGPTRSWTIAGPTCDSIDSLSKSLVLPASLQPDDRLFIGHLGAYCYCCTTEFNGFPAPVLQFV